MEQKKQISRLKLNLIDKNELKKREQLDIRGGDGCCGYCVPSQGILTADWEETYKYKDDPS